MLALSLLLACSQPEGPLPLARAPSRGGRADEIVAADLATVRLRDLVLPIADLPDGDRVVAPVAEALADADHVRFELHPELPVGRLAPLLTTVGGLRGCDRAEIELAVQGGVIPLPVARLDDLLAAPLGDVCPTGRLAGAPQVWVLPDALRVRVRGGADTTVPSPAELPGALEGGGPVVVVALRDDDVQGLVELLDVLRHDAGREPEILTGVIPP